MNPYKNNHHLLIDVVYEYTNNLLEHENWDALNELLCVAKEMCVEYCIEHVEVCIALLSQTYSERHRFDVWELLHVALSAGMGPLKARRLLGHLDIKKV